MDTDLLDNANELEVTEHIWDAAGSTLVMLRDRYQDVDERMTLAEFECQVAGAIAECLRQTHGDDTFRSLSQLAA